MGKSLCFGQPLKCHHYVGRGGTSSPSVPLDVLGRGVGDKPGGPRLTASPAWLADGGGHQGLSRTAKRQNSFGGEQGAASKMSPPS